jgi:mRNA-degrading endonuclease toxin of MazEF toxin-antitoxin module
VRAVPAHGGGGVLVERLGRLGTERMADVCDALAVAVDCNP